MEEISIGVPGIFNLLAYERNFLPASLRFTPLADILIQLIDTCSAAFASGQQPPPEECAPFVPLVLGGCALGIRGIGGILSNPTSKGNVTMGQNGELEVDCSYLSTPDDQAGFGSALIEANKLLNSLGGDFAPQTPCADDGPECALSCPDLFKQFSDTITTFIESNPIIQQIQPDAFDQFVALNNGVDPRSNPATTVFPSSVQLLAESQFPDFVVGNGSKELIISPHHFAGTASIGHVVDTKFKVIGVDGLYVADASVIPTTPRVNSMATALMVGRLAGVSALQELQDVA